MKILKNYSFYWGFIKGAKVSRRLICRVGKM